MHNLACQKQKFGQKNTALLRYFVTISFARTEQIRLVHTVRTQEQSRSFEIDESWQEKEMLNHELDTYQ
jgi:hypothetical protein